MGHSKIYYNKLKIQGEKARRSLEQLNNSMYYTTKSPNFRKYWSDDLEDLYEQIKRIDNAKKNKPKTNESKEESKLKKDSSYVTHNKININPNKLSITGDTFPTGQNIDVNILPLNNTKPITPVIRNSKLLDLMNSYRYVPEDFTQQSNSTFVTPIDTNKPQYFTSNEENDSNESKIKNFFDKVFSTQGWDAIKNRLGLDDYDIEENTDQNYDMYLSKIKQLEDEIARKDSLLTKYQKDENEKYSQDSLNSLGFFIQPTRINKGNFVRGIVNNKSGKFSFTNPNMAKKKDAYDILSGWEGTSFIRAADMDTTKHLFNAQKYINSDPEVGQIEQYPGYIGITPDGKLIPHRYAAEFNPDDMIMQTYWSPFDEMSRNEWRKEPNNSNEWHTSRQIRLKKLVDGKLVNADALSSYHTGDWQKANSLSSPVSGIIEAIMPNGNTVSSVMFGQTKDGMIDSFNQFKSNFDDNTTFRYYSTDAGFNKRSYNIGQSGRRNIYTSIYYTPNRNGGRKSLETI